MELLLPGAKIHGNKSSIISPNNFVDVHFCHVHTHFVIIKASIPLFLIHKLVKQIVICVLQVSISSGR